MNKATDGSTIVVKVLEYDYVLRLSYYKRSRITTIIMTINRKHIKSVCLDGYDNAVHLSTSVKHPNHNYNRLLWNV